jgi:hypothetical protein
LLAPIYEQYLAGDTVVMVLVVDDAVVTLTLIVVVMVGEVVVVVVLVDFEAKFNLFLSLLCMRKLFPENPNLLYSCQHTV